MVDPALATTLPALDWGVDAARALQASTPAVAGFEAAADAAGSRAPDAAGSLTPDVTGSLAPDGTANATTTANETATTTAGGDSGGGAWFDLSWLKHVVETATGWVGLGIIAVYSFLIAFVLPLPSEVVLFAPLELGLPWWTELGLIIIVSGMGKAAGSVFAFHIGQEAKESGPVISYLRRSRFDVVEWSENKTVAIARRYGYFGLALALCVPGFPDTLSIYAFSVLEEDYVKFALATFAGSVGRLVLWEAGFEAVVALI